MAETPALGARLAALYQRVWKTCATLMLVIWPLRLNIILAAIAWYALCGIDQSLDAQRALINEFAADGLWRRFGVTVAACAAFAGNLWFWSRATLDIVFPNGISDPLASSFGTWIPRVLGVVPPLAMAWSTITFIYQRLFDGETQQGIWQLVIALVCWLVLAGVLGFSYYARRRVIKKIQDDLKANKDPGFLGHFVAPATEDSKIVRLLDVVLPKGLTWLLFGATGLRSLGPGAQIALITGFFVGSMMVFFAVFEPVLAAGIGAGPIIPIGPLATLMFGIAVWVVILHPFMIASIRGRFPLVVLIVLTFGISGWLGWNENHAVRFSQNAPIEQPIHIKDDFVRWVAERHQEGRQFPVFIVAAEGGGIRAAYFTAMALSVLDKEVPRFREHLYAISGVSGGSVGAALYATMVRDQEASSEGPVPVGPPDDDERLLIRQTQNALSRDLLSPVLARLLTSDLAIEAIPFVPSLGPRLALPDRARALEHAAEDAYVAALGRTPRYSLDMSFYALRPTPGPGQRSNVPALVFNTTRVETGERIIVSHLTLDDPPPSSDAPPAPRLVPDGPPFNPTALHSLVQRDLAISTAAFLSARFPVVTPAGTFKAPDPRFNKETKHRLADGGYFENSGTATALNIVHHLANLVTAARANPAYSPLDDVCIHVIQLRFREQTPDDKHSYDEIASPIRALMNTRGARGELSRDTIQHALTLIQHPKQPVPTDTPDAENPDASPEAEHTKETPVDDEVICLEYTSGKIPIPLGWFLSTPACRSIEIQLTEYDEKAKSAPEVMRQMGEAARSMKAKNAEAIEAIRAHFK